MLELEARGKRQRQPRISEIAGKSLPTGGVPVGASKNKVVQVTRARTLMDVCARFADRKAYCVTESYWTLIVIGRVKWIFDISRREVDKYLRTRELRLGDHPSNNYRQCSVSAQDGEFCGQA